MPHIDAKTVRIINPRIQRLIGPSPEEGGLLLDSVTFEKIGHEAIKTAFPIEVGAEISDHLIPLPGLYSLRGVVSDRPLRWFHTDYQHSDSSTRHLSAYAILRDLWTARETFSIKTGFLSIDVAVLVLFEAEKTAKTANSFDFVAQIDEMLIVNTSDPTIEEGSVAPDAEGLVPVQAGGKKTLQPVEDNRTLFKTVFDAAFGGP